MEIQSENNKKTWQEPQLKQLQVNGGETRGGLENSFFYNYNS
jgi:hypothetical protein